MFKILGFIAFSFLSFYSQAQNFAEPTTIDPFTGDTYQEIAVGPTFYHSGFRNKYYYRFVTLYDEHQVEEAIDEYPRIQEFCHEYGNRFASWTIEKVFSRNISTSIGFELLGLDLSFGAERSREVVFAFERWIIAVSGVEAIHTPMIRHKVRQGITYQQTFYPATGKSVNSKLSHNEFYMDYIDPIFVAHREVIGECN